MRRITIIAALVLSTLLAVFLYTRPQKDAPKREEEAHELNAPEPTTSRRNLARIYAEMPDNLYFKVGMPTDDPETLKRREEDARARNQLYGKVLSGTASEDEITEYYAYKEKLSEDYIQFAERVLKTTPKMRDEERGLFELSRKMHIGKLAELPKQKEEALARKKQQDEKRAEWKSGGLQ